MLRCKAREGSSRRPTSKEYAAEPGWPSVHCAFVGHAISPCKTHFRYSVGECASVDNDDIFMLSRSIEDLSLSKVTGGNNTGQTFYVKYLSVLYLQE